MNDLYREEAGEDRRLSVEQVAVLCAWCLSEQGIPAGEGSHGICKDHAEQFLVQGKDGKMKEALELSLSEWRSIALSSNRQELKDYIYQFLQMDGAETFVLHPVDRDRHDTGDLPAIGRRKEAVEWMESRI